LKRPVFNIILFWLFLLIISCQKDSESIYLEYLGHSAVFIDFGHDVSVLCDYGEANAYLEWGWDSPIYDAKYAPDILCYSHFHPDHYDSLRASSFQSLRVFHEIDTMIGDLHIRSFPSSEKDISLYDNISYLFEFQGMKVLHLGDCQADILAIRDPAHAWNIEHRYPKNCDVLIMPIEGMRSYPLQAVEFAKLLSPKILLPTHYWSIASKMEFIKIFQDQDQSDRKTKYHASKRSAYKIKSKEGPLELLLLDLRPCKRKKR
jgi:L-ascorbate metabolism protein UlaG (beta-lactamase superfamily)